MTSINRPRIWEIYNELRSLPEEADRSLKQKRGREIESLIKSLLELEKLQPRLRFRPEGEELDGSFQLNGNFYLLEVKWHSAPSPASSIYAFKGKVDGKLTGTIGFFISIAGFSKDAVNALGKGKDINVLLFDGNDLEIDIKENKGFANACEAKLRAAADEGLIFYPLEATDISKKLDDHSIVTEQVSTSKIDTISSQAKPDLIILSEGITDRLILMELISKAISETLSGKRVKLIDVGGASNLPPTFKGISTEYPNSKYFIIIDDDFIGKQVIHEIGKFAIPGTYTIYQPSPSIEDWLPESKDLPDSTKSYLNRIHEIRARAMKIEPDELKKTNKQFDNFWRDLLEFLKK